MSIQTDIYTPRTMGKVVGRIAPARTFLRDTFFRNTETFVTKSVEVDFRKGNRALAPFVHPVIGGKVVKNSGYATKRYTPPLVAPNRVTTLDDLMRREAGESPYGGKTPAERAIAKMARDFEELDEMITRREEWMAAEALFSGQIRIQGDGLDEVIDFEFENSIVIADASKKWSAPTSDPVGDLEGWHEKVQKDGFVNCDVCVMASDVAAAFLNHEKVQKLLDVKSYDLAAIKPRELPSGATYVGTLNGLGLDIYKYNEWYLDDWTDPAQPVQKPLVPGGRLALLSTGASYSMYYGAISYIDGKTGSAVTVEGRRVPDTWVEKRPDRRFLALQAAPLPVPHEVNSWLVATVLDVGAVS